MNGVPFWNTSSSINTTMVYIGHWIIPGWLQLMLVYTGQALWQRSRPVIEAMMQLQMVSTCLIVFSEAYIMWMTAHRPPPHFVQCHCNLLGSSTISGVSFDFAMLFILISHPLTILVSAWLAIYKLQHTRCSVNYDCRTMWLEKSLELLTFLW